MKTLLVTGASGFLGWHICQKAKLDWKIVGTFCSRLTTIPSAKLIKVDLTVYSELKQLFKDAKLNPCRQREIRMAAPRPLDVSLTHEKATKMGFQPETIKASLKRLKARADL